MQEVVILLGMLAFAYLLGAVLSPSERRRFGLVSGAEFFVLGGVLGPTGLGFFRADFVHSVAPAIVAACAWLAFLHGMRLRRTRVAALPRRRLVSALLQPVLCALLIALMLLAGVRALGVQISHWTVLVWALAASSGSLSALAWARSNEGIDEARELSLRAVAGYGGSVSLIALAFVPLVDVANVWSALALVGASLLGAVLFAGLVVLLIGRGELDRDFTWVAMVGFLTLGSGMALQIGTPLVSVSVLMGIGIGWLSPHADAIDALIEKTEKPAMVLLLFLLGVQLVLSAQIVWLALLLVAARLLATTVSGGAALLAPKLGFGLWGGGEAGALIIAAAALVRSSQETTLLLCAYGGSLIIGDVVGAPLLRRLLRKEVA